MKQKEGLPVLKLMMLVSSMAPLFVLIGIRGIQIRENDKLIFSVASTWYIISALIIVPYVVIRWRLFASIRSKDVYVVRTSDASLNKEYLFTYLFTVLLPLYSVSISSRNELYAVACAIFFVLFVLWNMNMHFINILFAFSGYRVFTLPNEHGAILLSTRQKFSSNIEDIKAHRLSNSVFIELKNHQYDNR